MNQWSSSDTPGAEDDEPFRQVFDQAIVPLPPRAGTFADITKRARRRRTLHSATVIASVASAVAAVGLAGIAARHAAQHSPETSRLMPPVHSPATAATPQCSSADLAVSPGDQVAGPTRIGFTVLVINISENLCQITGYPAVTIRALIGSGPSLTVAHGGTSLVADQGPHAVALLPGTSAVAEIEWSTPKAGCQGAQVGGIQIEATVPGGATYRGELPSTKGCFPADPAVTALQAMTNTSR